MWSRGTAAVAAGALTMVALAAQAAAAAEPPRQTYSDRFTTEFPGASAGRTFPIDYVNPRDPEGKPHAFSHLHLELAEGARFDTSAIPHCDASDAQITAQGPSACPPESKVGDDDTLVDTGFPGPGRYFTSDFVSFNNKDELILLATVRENGARVVLRGRIGRNTLDIEVPMLPGTPPEGGAAKRQRGRFDPRSSVRDGRRANYLTTPPTCPASGFWVNRITYTYRDGVTQTASSTSLCVRRGARRDNRRPSIRMLGVPRRRCTNRAFRVRVRIAERWSGLRRAALYLDGRRIHHTSRRRFSRRIAARSLRRGRHRLTVRAVDRAGNVGRATRRFRRCGSRGAARGPTFVG